MLFIKKDGKSLKDRGDKMIKEAKIIFRFFKAAVERYNNYKVEYLYALLVTFPVFFPAVMWYFIVGEGSIAGWTFNKLLSLSIFYGIFISFLDTFGFWNVWTWLDREDRVVLTSMLTKPINPLLYVYGINFFPGGIVKLIIFVISLSFLIITNNLEVGFAFIIILFFSFLSVFLFLSSIIAIMLSYDKSATPLMYIVWNFLKVGDFPVSSIGGIGGLVLTYIIPVAFMAVIPAKALELNDYSMLLPSFFMVVVMYALLKLGLWHSMKRFESVGG